jgi:hypothetical protein
MEDVQAIYVFKAPDGKWQGKERTLTYSRPVEKYTAWDKMKHGRSVFAFPDDAKELIETANEEKL